MKSIISHIGERQYAWTFRHDGACSCNGRPVEIDMRTVSDNRISVLAEGLSFDATVTSSASSYEILINGILFKVDVETLSAGAARQWNTLTNLQPTRVEVRSPMPGMVVRVEVTGGAIVEAGDGLLILEAMKMENEIRAKTGGAVRRVFVSDRQIVEKGQLLLVIQ
jgi:biotin carboxyl carrier protein